MFLRDIWSSTCTLYSAPSDSIATSTCYTHTCHVREYVPWFMAGQRAAHDSYDDLPARVIRVSCWIARHLQLHETQCKSLGDSGRSEIRAANRHRFICCVLLHAACTMSTYAHMSTVCVGVYVCMYACMHACMHACICVRVFMHIRTREHHI